MAQYGGTLRPPPWVPLLTLFSGTTSSITSPSFRRFPYRYDSVEIVPGVRAYPPSTGGDRFLSHTRGTSPDVFEVLLSIWIAEHQSSINLEGTQAPAQRRLGCVGGMHARTTNGGTAPFSTRRFLAG